MNRRLPAPPSRGYLMIELAATLAIAAVLVAGLSDATSVALQTRAATSVSNDLAVQAGFALSRMVATVRATTPPATGTALAAAVANSTGSWLSPVTYTLNPATGILAETSDSGTFTLASNVTAFSAAVHTAGATSSAAYTTPVIDLSLTLGASGQQPVTVATSVRLGGGILP